MSRFAGLLLLASLAGATATLAAGDAPAVKPAEVSTIGAAPAVPTEADRVKLAEVLRRAVVQRAAANSAAPGLAVKPADVATRVPAVGPRDRRKPEPPTPAARP